MKKIYLSPPHLSNEEKKAFIKAFDSNWISSVGPDINKFEDAFCQYLDIGYGCALSSGTAALHLALKVLGIGKGDIVLCSSLTFSASANVILYEDATPIFLDSNKNFWTLDIEVLEYAIKKYKPKALIAVDIYGQCCDYDSIKDI